MTVFAVTKQVSNKQRVNSNGHTTGTIIIIIIIIINR